MYTVFNFHVCLQARRGHQISLQMVVSHQPCGCWELNSGPPEKQSVLLTSEPSLQPPSVLHLAGNRKSTDNHTMESLKNRNLKAPHPQQ